MSFRSSDPAVVLSQSVRVWCLFAHSCDPDVGPEWSLFKGRWYEKQSEEDGERNKREREIGVGRRPLNSTSDRNRFAQFPSCVSTRPENEFSLHFHYLNKWQPFGCCNQPAEVSAQKKYALTSLFWPNRSRTSVLLLWTQLHLTQNTKCTSLVSHVLKI